MTESLPSGVLKVADPRIMGVLAYLRWMAYQCEGGTRDTLQGYAEAIRELAALASPPPQATGALSEDARDAARYRTLRHSLSGEAGCSHTQMPTIQDPRNSMLTYLPHGLDQALDAIISERNAHD